MSRVGSKPIQLDSRVKVQIDGGTVTVTGPKGSLSFTIPAAIAVTSDAGQIVVTRDGETGPVRARHGMVRSILNNMMVGVTTGYRRDLELQGVGYRGQLKGARGLSLSLGLSGPVEYEVPEGVKVTMADPTHISVEGADKQSVGQAAATIRGFRPPDAYQGKGIRYAGERVTLKEGKTVG